MTTQDVAPASSKQASAFSRRDAPELLSENSALKQEGAGNAGCPMPPQPRVRFVVLVCTRVFTAEAPDTSGIPHAMVLRLIRALPGDHGLVATVVGAMREHHRRLSACFGAPEPHDFAVRFKRRSSSVASASTASHPAFVTTRTPLLSRRDGVENTHFPIFRK